MANTVKIGISASDEGFKSTMQQAASSVAGLGSAMGNTSKQFNTVNGALRAARKEAIELTAQWRALDDEAKNSDFGQSLHAQLQSVLQTAGELQDIKGDVANEIKNLASDTTMWDGMAQGIGVVSSSMQGLAGVVGLAGGDVQAFTQALTVMNTVQSVTNTIIGIGNALQQDSALMVMLRAAKTALLTTATTASTVAETANTAAKTGNTAATVANTAATGAQTVAQLANNAAVMANPYVLAAAAVAALVGAIVIWISSTEEATESQLANAAAVDALTEAMDTEMKKAADQINAFLQLKQTYDECGGSVDQIKKKVIQNTEQQKKAQIQVKNLDQATRIFSAQGTQAFIEGANARAMAMAAEAAVAAQLALVMKELGAALAKVAAGEEVNISDVEEIAKKAGMSADRFKSLARAAGFYEEHVGMFAKNNLRLLDGNDPIEAQQQLMSKVSEYMMNEGTGKVLQEMAKNWKAQASVSLAPYDDVVQSAEEVQNAAKGADKAHTSAAKSASKSARTQAAAQKSAREEIKKTLNTLEGCDAIIQEAEKNIKKLDKTSSNYAQRKQELENTILIAKRAKLDFFKDADTLKGLNEYKKLLQDIKDLLPADSKMIADIDKELEETANKIQQMYEQKANSMLPEDLEDLQKFYTDMLKGMKSTDDEYTGIVLKLKKVNNELAKIKQTQDDITSGIQQGSKTWYKRIYEEQLSNVNALMNNTPFSETESPDLRRYTGQMLSAYDINMDYLEQALRQMYTDEGLENALHDIRDENGNKPEKIEDIEGIWNQTLEDYKDWLTKKIQAMSVEQQAWNLPTLTLDVTFDYKKSENERIDERLQKIIDARDELKQLMDNQMIAPSSMDTATEALSEYNREINNLKRNKVFNELNDDIQEYSKNVRDGVIGAVQAATDNVKTLYDAFTSLPEKLSDAENAFEAFFDVLDTLFSIVNGVISMIDTIKSLSEAIDLLTGAQTAQDAMTQRTSALLSEQVVILGALDAAQTTKMATDQAAVIPEAEKAAAAKATAMMLEQEAASAMFAAHAEIPFVGAALGAAQVAIMEGVLGGIKATQMLANGGIIQGSTTMGDRILVRANAGEMVLNRKQQANLFKALDEGVGTSQGYTVSNVRIKGSDLYLALKNYSKIKGKSGLTTGIQ